MKHLSDGRRTLGMGRIPIRYELLNDSKPMFQVTEAVINDMVIEAGYHMGLYDYENNAEDVIIDNEECSV